MTTTDDGQTARDVATHEVGHAVVATPPRWPYWAPGQCCPGCGGNHRTWRAVAGCRWRKSQRNKTYLIVIGDPPASGPCYAVLCLCPNVPGGRFPTHTVYLYAALEDAEEKLTAIRQHGRDCCRWGWHDLHVMRPAGQAVPA
jgi:hypothetical protein